MTFTGKKREELKDLVHKYWLFSHYSIRKITTLINLDKKYGTISHQTVANYVKELRRESERWLDEDVIEKYTGEFVRKQMAFDEEIDNLGDAMDKLDQNEPKELELWLKLLNAKHQIEQDQLRNMTEIELVLRVKTLSQDQRKKFETLKLKPKELADSRGYHLIDTTDSSKELKPDSNN